MSSEFQVYSDSSHRPGDDIARALPAAPVEHGGDHAEAFGNVVMPTFGRASSGRRKRSARAAAFGEARGVLIAIAQEAHDVALLVAVTGSIVNAIVASKRPQLRVSMATYLPHQPTAFPAAIGTNAISAALPATTIQALTAFYGLVTFARTATLSYSARREPGGITGPISMDTIGEAWQAAATQAIGVLSQLGYLDQRSPLTTATGTNPAALRLIETLWSVTLGRTPCVRIDGAVVVPGWIDRRTHSRQEINAPAVVKANGESRAVTVRDMSAGGFGIDGCTGIGAGTAIEVSLGSGVDFSGTVVWSRDDRIGVRLNAPPSYTAVTGEAIWSADAGEAEPFG